MNHEHTHHNHHSSLEESSLEENIALLSYMISHNKHHAEELNQLAGNTDGIAAELIKKAVFSFSDGNRFLEEALMHLKKGE